MIYADVILPLPLEGVFTYSVPDSLKEQVKTGFRVLVPFGRSKTYIGIVANIHDNTPTFKVKDISAVLDNSRMVIDKQLRLWQWISKYYMSSIGDVYNAAFPAGLKNNDSYRPKTEIYITLAPSFRNKQSVDIALSMLKQAKKQKELLICYLSLSCWDKYIDNDDDTNIREVSREELLNESHCTVTVLRNLLQRNILNTYEREVGRLNTGKVYDTLPLKALSDKQQDAYNNILFNFIKKDVVLFHGVTSSGKTEIYIHLIQQALDKGQQVLYLLPEIALTVQICQRLRKVFGQRLGIYHSGYSDAERVEIWKKQISDSPYDVILGARSAVLLPFSHLGMIIIDEEHESSFKQQDPAPRYHARSVAIMMAQMYGAKTLLGSATPSIESLYNAQKGKYGYVRLNTRFGDISLPDIQVVDVKDLRRRKIMTGSFSPPFLAAIRSALQSGRQAIIFQNRRGFAPMIECKTCGWVPRCKHCDVPLTYHKRLGKLTCHYCGAIYEAPSECPACGSKEIIGRGLGTEKIEDIIATEFPEARISRMDLDTTRSRDAYEHIISDFASKRTNILIGTQMVTKGLDFDNVGVVGILDADSMLNSPDYRAYEQAFSMMSQVAGRAGRKGERGLVILQTKSPQLPVISQITAHDCDSFYAEQIEERRLFIYPPFCRLIYVYLRHREERVVDAAAIVMGNMLRSWFGERILGPDKPAVSRIKTMHIRKLLIKLELGINHEKARAYLHRAYETILNTKEYKTVQIYFDVDP
ncbi:MAG: primosomal protein N' [Paraprevotella sp.]|nr:primosomal protein N' [Paraprevotella sp.]